MESYYTGINLRLVRLGFALDVIFFVLIIHYWDRFTWWQHLE